MASEARSCREVLVKQGTSESVLEQFLKLLDQFDAALALGNDGRVPPYLDPRGPAHREPLVHGRVPMLADHSTPGFSMTSPVVVTLSLSPVA